MLACEGELCGLNFAERNSRASEKSSCSGGCGIFGSSGGPLDRSCGGLSHHLRVCCPQASAAGVVCSIYVSALVSRLLGAGL